MTGKFEKNESAYLTQVENGKDGQVLVLIESVHEGYYIVRTDRDNHVEVSEDQLKKIG